MESKVSDEELWQKHLQEIEASQFTYSNQQAAKVITEYFTRGGNKDASSIERKITEELEKVLDCDFKFKVDKQEDLIICNLDFGLEQKGLRIEIKNNKK